MPDDAVVAETADSGDESQSTNGAAHVRIPEALEQLFRNDLNARSEST